MLSLLPSLVLVVAPLTARLGFLFYYFHSMCSIFIVLSLFLFSERSDRTKISGTTSILLLEQQKICTPSKQILVITSQHPVPDVIFVGS